MNRHPRAILKHAHPAVVALIGVGALTLTGCGAGSPVDGWAGRVDTLANGAVHAVSPAEGLWRPGEEWRLVEDLRIGRADGSGPDVFGDLNYLVVDRAGRMWAMDRLATEIRVFDGNGELVRRVGRRGAGPGEFAARFNPMIPDLEGDVWVNDYANGRWQRFDSAGTLVGVYPRTGSNIGPFRWGADGRLRDGLVSGRSDNEPPLVKTFVLGSAGELVPSDTFAGPVLPEPDEMMEVRRINGELVTRLTIPLTVVPRWHMDSEGDFWIADGGGSYRIVRRRIEGDTVLILEREYQPVPVPDSARAAALPELDPDLFTLSIDAEDVPRTYPPFLSVELATDGYIWVIRNLAEGMGFDVFDPAGRFLGTVALGAARPGRLTITDRHLYGVVRDELGVQSIVRLRIEKSGP